MLTTNVGVTTTYFVGNYYEVVNGVVTKYYYAGSTRIAIRENGVLSYLISDHLGSTSIITDASGNVIAQQKYKAWGETRYSSGTNPSEYSYTGQYSYTDDFGLMFYQSRFYDPSLGRFAQADILIPVQQGVQAWDRYAYVNNSPVNYADPSGNYIPCYGENYDDGPKCRQEGSPSKWYYDNWDYQYTEEFKKAKEELKEYGYVGLSLLFEPADWAMTLEDCANGNCSLLGLLFMAVPGLSGKGGSIVDDAIQAFWRSEFVKYPSAPYAILGFSRDTYQEIARGLEGSFLWSSRYNEYIQKFGEPAFWKNINEPYIDEIIAAGKDVFLATPLKVIQDLGKGNTFDEITKLLDAGYTPSGSWLIPPPKP